ncbi:hypothetical protein [Haladaptatus caseinilyticus]|uniref:hypothetical protein n=1 Tax=Haladaptatus caseinilyticus TaxID=2993314 RepID=UPI00224B0067|nr:hypothetical protein [Haladaptatus caseinilyticus]
MSNSPASLELKLFGRRDASVTAIVVGVMLAFFVSRQVATTNSYLSIERSLPTYDGTISGPFAVMAAVLVTLAALSTYFGAGMIPAIHLTGGPVFGWAIIHRASPITPPYASTFPLEMVILYGGIFGVTGYLL